jgi:O-antigen ligase
MRTVSSTVAEANRGAPWRHSLPAWLMFAILAIAPFPFGSVSPVMISALCGLAGLAIAGLALRATALPSPMAFGVAVLVLIVAYSTVLFLQLVPRQSGDALTHPIWAETAELLGQPLTGSASIARSQPLFAVGAPLLTVMLFVGGYMCGADDRLARRLIQTIAWAGGCYAMFAIGSFAIDPSMVLWEEKIAYTTSLTGTFTNRNAAAVYFGSIAIIWLIILFQRLESRRRRRSRHFRPSRSWSKLRRFGVPLIFFTTCLIAALLSSSRAGVACTFVGLLIVFTLAFRKTLSRPSKKWLVFGGVVFAILMIYQVLDSGVGDRLQNEGLADGGRATSLRSLLLMISDFPWLGTGLGTFRWSFPAYRSSGTSGWGVWDKAHNVLFEIATDGGVVLAALVLLAWVVTIYVLLQAVARDPRSPPLVRAALAVSMVAILHSFVDFSMQIPAYAITVAAVVGAGLAQALQPVEPRRRIKVEVTTPPATPGNH